MTPAMDITSARWSVADGLALDASAVSVPGPVRPLNEDSALIAPPVYVVADGMGGHRAGDVASRLVTERFAALAAIGEVTADAVARCLDACRDEISALETEGPSAPGTTVVAAVLVTDGDRPYWLIANIGDSRAYLWAGGDLRRLSRDHSVVQELLDSGSITESEARTHPERHVITRALGARMEAPVDYSMIPVEAGTRLLLCSDGICGPLSGPDLAHHLARLPEAGSAAAALVDAAVAAGGKDNLTAVVIDVIGPAAAISEDTVGQPLVVEGESR